MLDIARDVRLQGHNVSFDPVTTLSRSWGVDPVVAFDVSEDCPLAGAFWRFAACHERDVPEIDADLLCVALSGAEHLSVRMGGRDLGSGRSAPGSVRVVPAHTSAHIELHDQTARDPFACFHLYIPPSAFRALGLKSRVRLDDPEQGKVDPWLETIARRLSDTDPLTAPAHLESSYLALAALAHVNRRYGDAPHPAATGDTKGGLAAWQQRRATAFIEANLTREIRIAELAGICRLSQFHFARAFRHSLGRPPHSYLTMRRLELARKLLADPKNDVLEIAASVGYESSSHFARVFKRHLGVTPTEYRRQL